MGDFLSHIKQKLWERFKEKSISTIDKNGYVLTPQENLLPGINLADFEDDYMQGSGNELEGKFLAVHSSSALVANTFARWYKTPSKLLLYGNCSFIDLNNITQPFPNLRCCIIVHEDQKLDVV